MNSAPQIPPRVVVVGSINMDLVIRLAKLPRPGQTVVARESVEVPGGKGANQAVAAARLGASVSMVGRVGDDGFGERLRAGLASAGVDVRHVIETEQCASGLAVVTVEDSGENAIAVVPGANGRLSAEDVADAEKTIRSADLLLVQLEAPLETVAAAASLARRHQVLTVLDPAPAPASLPDGLFPVDVLCPNESEAAAMTGASLETPGDVERAAIELRRLGARHAVVTLGSRGAMLCSGDGDDTCLTIPASKIEPVDTTAAGDAFAAALGVWLATGHNIAEAVRFACAAGAIAASRPGAQPAMPTRAEIMAMLES